MISTKVFAESTTVSTETEMQDSFTPMSLVRLFKSIEFFIGADDYEEVYNIVNTFMKKWDTSGLYFKFDYINSDYFTCEEYSSIVIDLATIQIAANCKLSSVILTLIQNIRHKILDKVFMTDMLVCNRLLKSMDNTGGVDVGDLKYLPNSALWKIRQEVHSWC